MDAELAELAPRISAGNPADMAEVDRARHQPRGRGARMPALLAAVWALAFAATSAYWAAGGTGSAHTIAHSLADRC
jgi:hypothetical protein